MGEDAAAKRAIILIPGMQRAERFARRDRLVDNLATVERHPLAVGDDVELEGEVGRRLLPVPVRGAAVAAVETHVFEAYWADMVATPLEDGPWGKLWGGFELLVYWFLSPGTWRAFAISRFITFGLLVSGLLLILWYVSLALLVAGTLRGVDPGEIASLPVLNQLYAGFLWLTSRIETFTYWALIAFVLSVVNADALAQMGRFAKEYLQNRPDEHELGLRDRVRSRVTGTLQNVLRAGYGEVVVVAHSFGSVIALDVLADWPHDADQPRLRLVTLGSPVAVLACRSPWLDAERAKLLAAPPPAWIDFHSPTDWLCTRITAGLDDADTLPVANVALRLEAPPADRLTGRTHLGHDRSQPVLETLATLGLGAAPA